MIGLYNPRPIVGQSFKGVKRVTVPNQSLSLREIVRKFVRREPIMTRTTEGVYETRFGDLEKVSQMDMFDQLEVVDQIKSDIDKFNASEKAQHEKELAAAKAAADAKYKADLEAEVLRQTAGKVSPV